MPSPLPTEQLTQTAVTNSTRVLKKKLSSTLKFQYMTSIKNKIRSPSQMFACAYFVTFSIDTILNLLPTNIFFRFELDFPTENDINKYNTMVQYSEVS